MSDEVYRPLMALTDEPSETVATFSLDTSGTLVFTVTLSGESVFENPTPLDTGDLHAWTQLSMTYASGTVTGTVSGAGGAVLYSVDYVFPASPVLFAAWFYSEFDGSGNAETIFFDDMSFVSGYAPCRLYPRHDKRVYPPSRSKHITQPGRPNAVRPIGYQ